MKDWLGHDDTKLSRGAKVKKKKKLKGQFFKAAEVFFFIVIPFNVVPIFSPLLSSAKPIPCSHSQSPNCCPCQWAIYTCSLTSPSPFFPLLPSLLLSSGSCQCVPCFHICGSVLFVSLFCLLDHSYKW